MSPTDWCLFVLAFLFLAFLLRRIDQRLLGLEQYTALDPLTGLRSGRALDDDLESFARSQDPVGLLFIDLDDFRKKNEGGFYREVGDHALKTAAQRIQGCLRRKFDRGRCYRMHTGGDEFVVVMTPCTEEVLAAAAEAIRQALADNDTPASIGVEFRPAKTRLFPARMLQRAAARKDLAKRQGKNRVYRGVAAEEPGSVAVPEVIVDADAAVHLAPVDTTRPYTAKEQQLAAQQEADEPVAGGRTDTAQQLGICAGAGA